MQPKLLCRLCSAGFETSTDGLCCDQLLLIHHLEPVWADKASPDWIAAEQTCLIRNLSLV